MVYFPNGFSKNRLLDILRKFVLPLKQKRYISLCFESHFVLIGCAFRERDRFVMWRVHNTYTHFSTWERERERERERVNLSNQKYSFGSHSPRLNSVEVLSLSFSHAPGTQSVCLDCEINKPECFLSNSFFYFFTL
jgi:hypothetical protein